MLAKMDVERNISEIEIKVDHKFDDIKLIAVEIGYYFLIIDFDNISIRILLFQKMKTSIPFPITRAFFFVCGERKISTSIGTPGQPS